MLIIAQTLAELDFPQLMNIYIEANREHGEDLWPEKSIEEQISLSEQDFLAFLQNQFFTKSDALYMIWVEQGKYISALRLEPFRDGLLLEALETLPEERRKGYACKLITAMQKWSSGLDIAGIYAHVSKQNLPSLKTHIRCGFEIFMDHSVYNDGTHNDRAYTMRYQVKN